jgi:hypothetical protein
MSPVIRKMGHRFTLARERRCVSMLQSLTLTPTAEGVYPKGLEPTNRDQERVLPRPMARLHDNSI